MCLLGVRMEKTSSGERVDNKLEAKRQRGGEQADRREEAKEAEGRRRRRRAGYLGFRPGDLIRDTRSRGISLLETAKSIHQVS